MKKEILELREEGKTYKEIKEFLGCSFSTISYHCDPLGKQKTQERSKRNLQNSLLRRVNKALHTRYDNLFVRKKSKINQKTIREDKSFTFSEFLDVLNKNPYCYLTGRKLDINNLKSWHIDHIIPISKDGKTTLDNILPVCKEANQAKHNLSVADFINLCKDILIHNGYKVGVVGIEPTPS